MIVVPAPMCSDPLVLPRWPRRARTLGTIGWLGRTGRTRSVYRAHRRTLLRNRMPQASQVGVWLTTAHQLRTPAWHDRCESSWRDRQDRRLHALVRELSTYHRQQNSSTPHSPSISRTGYRLPICHHTYSTTLPQQPPALRGRYRGRLLNTPPNLRSLGRGGGKQYSITLLPND